MATPTPKIAHAFINLRIETTNGTKKLAEYGVPLYTDNAVHAKLIELIEGGADVNSFKEYLVLDYKANTKVSDTTSVEFGFAPKPPVM